VGSAAGAVLSQPLGRAQTYGTCANLSARTHAYRGPGARSPSGYVMPPGKRLTAPPMDASGASGKDDGR
jgi:hypothetical protein